MSEVNYRPCNICGHSCANKLFEKSNFTIVKCSYCSLVYIGESITNQELQEIYGESYYKSDDKHLFVDYFAEEEIRLASARSRITKLLKYCKQGKLLDIGCAAGFFLEAAKPYFDVQGIEFSEYSSKYAREYFGLNVFTGTLEQAKLPDNEFDMITMWDVIEHVKDPLAMLKEISRILKPGGYVVVSTGNVESVHAKMSGENWGLYTPPWHLYYFSRETLNKLAQKAGLKKYKITTSGIISTNRFLNNKVANKIVNQLHLGDIIQMVLTK